MKIITGNIEKKYYRNIEQKIFNIKNDYYSHFKLMFNSIECNEHSWLGDQSLYDKLYNTFKDTYPEFCISTIVQSEPIYLLNFQNDTVLEYNGILNFPQLIGLNYPSYNAGIAIVNEIVYMYNIDMKWCVYSNRYLDITLLASVR
jgi:hypothetical protein